MSEGVLVAVVLVGVLLAVGFGVTYVWDRRAGRRRTSLVGTLLAAPAEVPPPSVAAPIAEPPTPPAPPPQKPARDLITIRLVSATGRDLGTLQMDRKSRRPTLSHRPRRATATATFVADRQHNGQFVYRQVGQEREGRT